MQRNLPMIVLSSSDHPFPASQSVEIRLFLPDLLRALWDLHEKGSLHVGYTVIRKPKDTTSVVFLSSQGHKDRMLPPKCSKAHKKVPILMTDQANITIFLL